MNGWEKGDDSLADRIDDAVDDLCDCDAYRFNDPEWHGTQCPTTHLRALLPDIFGATYEPVINQEPESGDSEAEHRCSAIGCTRGGAYLAYYDEDDDGADYFCSDHCEPNGDDNE